MANMSYCRFENTARDFADCIDALAEALNNGKSVKEFVASLSDYEKHGFNSVMQSAQDFIAMVEEEEWEWDVLER